MPKRSSPSANTQPLGIAACALAVTSGSELQLLPAGAFSARDGRPHDAPGWRMDAALARRLIEAAGARGTPFVIDYEHQTLLAKDNGKPAPAAGWFRRMEWREGVGLFAVDVEWTDNAARMIEAKEYRFISPVIGYDKATGAVTSIYMAAITNNPAIDGMSEVLLTAAALHFQFSQPTPLTEDSNMEELLEQLRWLLNMAVGATAEDITAQLQKLIDQIKKDNPVATAAATFDLGAYLVALSTAAPDPAKYVPIETMNALRGHVAALTSSHNVNRVDETITAALASGKLLPAQETWARGYGEKDFAGLTAYLAGVTPIAALAAMQTTVQPPSATGTAALTDSQKKLCRLMGVSEADYLKTLQEDAA